ncbi:MAG: hypothetical protein ACWA45_02300, partial [Flavobacteriales bacterium]
FIYKKRDYLLKLKQIKMKPKAKPTFKRKKCKICSKLVKGRSDKIFCSVRCKNYYHLNLRKETQKSTLEIDKILHRNHSILLELLGKKTKKKMIPRIRLENKKFHFTYHTHTIINKNNKTFHWVYDIAWMSFSNDKVLITRNEY